MAKLLNRESGSPGYRDLPPSVDVDSPWRQLGSDEKSRIGRELVGPESFSCMTCHVHGDHPPTGSPGPAITQFAERLQGSWFRSYMLNPQRYKPGSRMPDFGVGGVSSLTAVLDADLHQQAAAMWSYFLLGEFMPPPAGVQSQSGFMLPVGERPVVHRGFLLDVGSRGIAVGTPSGVHYAFDAAACRLVHAWRGEFLDAGGSWAGRGGSELGGQGPVVWSATEGPTFQLVDQPDVKPSYRGYRLDAEGYPTFMWELGPVRIEERFGVNSHQRHFTFEGLIGNNLIVARGPGRSLPRASGGAGFRPAGGALVLYAEEREGERPTLEVEVGL